MDLHASVCRIYNHVCMHIYLCACLLGTIYIISIKALQLAFHYTCNILNPGMLKYILIFLVIVIGKTTQSELKRK